MPNKCCVHFCNGNYNKLNRVHVFKFPNDSIIRKKWLQCVRRENLIITKNSVVCHRHFLPSDLLFEVTAIDAKTGRILTAPLAKPRIRPGALPSILPKCSSFLSRSRNRGKSLVYETLPEENTEQAVFPWDDNTILPDITEHIVIKEELIPRDIAIYRECFPTQVPMPTAKPPLKRIVDMNLLFDILINNQTHDESKSCSMKNMIPGEEIRNGSTSEFILKCQVCSLQLKIPTEIPEGTTQDSSESMTSEPSNQNASSNNGGTKSIKRPRKQTSGTKKLRQDSSNEDSGSGTSSQLPYEYGTSSQLPPEYGTSSQVPYEYGTISEIPSTCIDMPIQPENIKQEITLQDEKLEAINIKMEIKEEVDPLSFESEHLETEQIESGQNIANVCIMCHKVFPSVKSKNMHACPFVASKTGVNTKFDERGRILPNDNVYSCSTCSITFATLQECQDHFRNVKH